MEQDRRQRLFVDAPLGQGVEVALDRDQANYLLNVLRLNTGAQILAFNGQDGEWLAALRIAGRKSAALAPVRQTRTQTADAGPWYLFAPLKHARLDYMVQKAVEMGAARLSPTLTQHSQITRINRERMRANAIEATEQCGALALPAIDEPATLAARLAGWDGSRHIVFCDEAADSDALAALRPLAGRPLAVLVGPEGGFSAEERATLLAKPFVTAIGLGPRILRADTAAVAALALVQAATGNRA
jgi:16S rRNA (uracil1498-N3)-methyltransferase